MEMKLVEKEKTRLIATQVDIEISDDITFMVFSGNERSKSDLLKKLVKKEHRAKYKKEIELCIAKYVKIWASRSTLSTLDEYMDSVKEALADGMRDIRNPENRNIKIILDGVRKKVESK